MPKINDYFSDLESKFNKNYFDFLNLILNSYSFDEINMIKKAYDIANNCHDGQKRKDGTPFITHPLNIAYFLAYYKFDYETICAALLHDTVEDTNYSLEDVKRDFNDVIANLVDGVTKMKGSDFISKSEAKKATHKKIINSITKDARIIAIKLVDRLHNMYTLDNLRREKQIEIANETNEFYVNLARILGVYYIKDDLEDLSLYFLDKDSFFKYNELREKIKLDNEEISLELAENIKDIVFYDEILMEYIYKIKNISGIYEEIKLGKKLSDINDLVALKILCPFISDCYSIFNDIKKHYNVDEESIIDYIANSKYNGYSSINSNILYKDSNIQFRIRTFDMNRKNSLGMVSNWSSNSQEVLNDKCSYMFEANKKELNKKRKAFKYEK